MKRQAEGVPPGQAAAFGTADVSTNTELKSSDFGGKRCFWKRPRLHDDIRDSGKGERTARAQQGESASGRPLAKGACPGVGRTGARPKRGRWLDRARDPRRPENPRLPPVGSSPGKAGTPGGGGEAVPGPAERPLPPPGEAGTEGQRRPLRQRSWVTWAPPAHGCAPRGRGAPAPAPCVGGLRRHRRPRGPDPPGQAGSPQRWRRNCSLDAGGGPRTPAGIPPSPQSSPCGSLDGSGLQPKESAPAGESRGGHREMPPPPPHSPGDPMTWSPDAHTERHG